MAALGKCAVHFLVFILVFTTSFQNVDSINEFILTCGNTIDLLMSQNVKSGIVEVAMPSSFAKYQDPSRPNHCDIILTFAAGMNLLIELYYVDIVPISSDRTACTTGLEIFDQTGRKYYGGRVCMEAWEWEERHQEMKQQKEVVVNSPLTFRLVSEGPFKGKGFKAHFNLFRPYWPCYTREFKCLELQRCVHDDLTCDGWDDCGDYSDEREDAGCDLLTASEICGLICGILLFIGTVAITVFFGITYCRLSNEYGVKSESKIPIVEARMSMDPVLNFPKRYNSQESMSTRYSRSTVPTMARRDSDSDSVVDKAELERPERYSSRAPDDISLGSYRSNPRRARGMSQVTDASADPVKKSGQYSYNGRKGRSSSQSSLNRDKVEPVGGVENTGMGSNRESAERKLGSKDRLSDRDRRDRRRDRDDYSDDDDDDRRYRRRSRDRDYRRDDRYSDDDSDYEDRRRRRRRRSPDDRYSDEDSDYEYERERRRRRSRDRYSRERDRYDDRDDRDTDPNSDRDKDRDLDRPPRRRQSRERDRYRDDYDDDKDRDPDRPPSRRRQSRERDRYRDSYEDDRDAPPRYDQHKQYRPSGERRDPSPPPPVETKSRSKDNLQPEVFEDEPLPPPPSGQEVRRMEQERERERRQQKAADRRSPPSDIKAPPQSNGGVPPSHRGAPAPDRREPPADDNMRRKSTDDRRERYNRSRWNPKDKERNPSSQVYEDVVPKTAFIDVGYKEETV